MNLLIACLVLTLALAAAVAYIVVGLFVKVDHAILKRRAIAGNLAGQLTKLGLTRTPKLLIAYSTGNYKEFLKQLDHAFHELDGNPDAVVKEIEDAAQLVIDNMPKATDEDVKAAASAIAAK